MRGFWGVWVVVIALLPLGCVGGDDQSGSDAAGKETSADVTSADVSSDAGASDGSVSDARCNVASPFGSVESVAELNTVNDDTAAFLTADELTVYWATTNDAGAQVRTSTRSSPTATFPAPTAATDLIGPQGTNSIWITPDGLTAVLVYTQSWQIELGTRANTQSTFGSFAPLTSLNTAVNYAASLRADGKEIFFGSPRSGPGQVYVATGSGTSFGTPQVFNQAAPSSSDGSPVLTADGLALYFSSNRPGGAGGDDIWLTRRASTSSSFGAPTRLAELATSVSEDTTWISADECVIYFNRGSVGSRDIYRAKRSP